MPTLTHPLPVRAQAAQVDRWLAERLHTVLPALLDRAGIDTWIVSAREYHEDPVMAALLPGEWHSARRRTILVLHRTADGVEAQAVARYPVGTAYTPVWQGNGTAGGGALTEVRDPETQWEALRRVVAARDPRRIGLDTSSTFALADGLSATEERAVLAALGPFAERVVSAEAVAIGLLETRLPGEIAAAHELNALAHRVISDAYGAVVIGTTTALDVAWWIEQRFADLGVPSWFRSTVDVQRRGVALGAVAEDAVVAPGDLLHCDVGLVSCRLHTDTQQNAYVLRPGEQAAPQGLVDALAVGNRMQDLTCAALAAGGTGNDVLAAARQAAADEGIDAAVYSHPVGLHGHAAGATIGLWDSQDGVPGAGDYPLYDNTIWALELCTYSTVPEWDGQRVRMALEQGVVRTDGAVHYLDERQSSLHLIGRDPTTSR